MDCNANPSPVPIGKGKKTGSADFRSRIVKNKKNVKITQNQSKLGKFRSLTAPQCNFLLDEPL